MGHKNISSNEKSGRTSAGLDFSVLDESRTVLQVHHFTHQFVSSHINQSQFTRYILREERNATIIKSNGAIAWRVKTYLRENTEGASHTNLTDAHNSHLVGRFGAWIGYFRE